MPNPIARVALLVVLTTVTSALSPRGMAAVRASGGDAPWPAPGGPQLSAPPPQLAETPPPATIELVVLDRAGKQVDTLTPADFAVTLDGVARRVAAVRFVVRGPGASHDARMLAGAFGTRGVETAAEPYRSVLIVADQTTMARGDEKAVARAADDLLGRLGLEDRIGVVRLPPDRQTTITLGSDRPAIQEALRAVTGLAVAAPTVAMADTAIPRMNEAPAAVDPDRVTMAEPEADPERSRMAGMPARPETDALDGLDLRRGNALQLLDLVSSLERVPGRKTVVVFSAGLVAADRRQLDDLAVAAAKARVVIYAFGVRGAAGGGDGAPDPGALETLARLTGGRYARLGRGQEAAIAQAAAEMSGRYVLTLEPLASDASSARRPVKVTVRRPGVTVRAPAWHVAGPAPDDEVAESPAYRLREQPAGGETPPAPVPELPAAEPPPSPADREFTGTGGRVTLAELDRAMSRLADYIEVYQREYSSLVAEEDYRQSTTNGRYTERQRLKADLLLIRVDGVRGWLSFRDVFEVNGKAVRERDERLQRLFISPPPDVRDRLKAIQTESGRYNLGPVTRTINDPLFPLSLLELSNQPRFDIRHGDRKTQDGIELWRVDFTEFATPTLVSTLDGGDQPSAGWFLFDPLSGVVYETHIVLRRGESRYIHEVKYRRDEKLGLWIPAEMKETYRAGGVVSMEGSARYSRFRRFQVATDTKITVPK